jgi:hypothetical protein
MALTRSQQLLDGIPKSSKVGVGAQFRLNLW